MNDADSDSIQKVRDLIGEHFTNFAFVVITEDDEIVVGHSSYHIADMLLQKGAALICESAIEVEFEDWDEEDDGEDWKE